MPKALKEKVLTLPEVKEILESLEESLDQFQRRTLDYATKFSKIDAKSAKELIKRLVDEHGLEKEEAIQIINCMPESIEELRTFLAGGRRIVETSKLEAIIGLLNEYRQKE